MSAYRTIQKYMRQVRTTRPRGQNWRIFLRNHAQEIWACDFLPGDFPAFPLAFRLFHYRIALAQSDPYRHHTISDRHAGPHVPRRFATAYGEGPKYLIRDNDGKFGVNFARVAQTSTIKILKTPYHLPQANAICERFLGSVGRECLDHLLILHEKQLQRVLAAYLHYAQPSQAASRDQAADSREIRWISASTSRRWQGPRLPDPGWVIS